MTYFLLMHLLLVWKILIINFNGVVDYRMQYSILSRFLKLRQHLRINT